MGGIKMGRLLKKEDILAYAIASTALSTGGGGVEPSLEHVGKMYDEAVAMGAKPELIDLKEVPDDAIVTSVVGAGGGVSSEMKMRWGSRGGRLHRDLPFLYDPGALRDKILENDATWCPLNSWSEILGPGFRRLARKRLMEILGIRQILLGSLLRDKPHEHQKPLHHVPGGDEGDRRHLRRVQGGS